MKTLLLGLALFIAPITSANAYVTVNPSSIEFGSVKIGSQSTQMFNINNFGNEDVQIFGCMVFGAFQCQLNCFGSLHRGQSCSGMIFFRPQSEQYEFESAMINTNEGSLNLSVHGSGFTRY